MSAPKKTVSILGYEIPLLEHMLAGEIMELEDLITSGRFTGTRGDLEALGVIVRHRLEKPFDVDELARKPIDMDELGEAVEKLTGPFARGLRSRKQRVDRLRASQLSAPELRKGIEQRQLELAELERMLAATGTESEPSSSPTTTAPPSTRSSGPPSTSSKD